MDVSRTHAVSIASSSSTQSVNVLPPPAPFFVRNGRRYPRDRPNPLPCDLAELQRQNLRTMLVSSVLGKPICCPPRFLPKTHQLRILDIGCGTGYWSYLIHQHLVSSGWKAPSFIGLDTAQSAPDLGKQGMDWRFVAHDLRRPLPFSDSQFDLVIMKDMSLVTPVGEGTQQLLDETIRVLKRGGALEIWECDHAIRCLQLDHSASFSRTSEEELTQAKKTATYPINSATVFGEPQNTYLHQASAWIENILDARGLSATPGSRMTAALLQEPDDLCEIGFRRVAVPLTETRWERESGIDWESKIFPDQEQPTKDQGDEVQSVLTDEQAALRATALMTVVQILEGLEPLLTDLSRKNAEEWARWWSGMKGNLLQGRGAEHGECLEIGAWWARKR
ncbi:hypothetical protein P152DRAFT_454217 [Eremomyces bilateralis CBS 781.70]|uniref:Methyltransferase domain-containing protein n=1 Tax=Eremomyces bilateralis CBS 781.70 TaxID=1392243 RepID=A0A6G1GI15_9PEZI|nr:uncharacterized protein P152DRAFT_454217 [Eremomyces bilateralis CBS 781.70]KAF1817644.1 hypothetical protein P152DRAFT_454217 [Eremomyces bilateralis CBS 781.70]